MEDRDKIESTETEEQDVEAHRRRPQGATDEPTQQGDDDSDVELHRYTQP